MSLLFLATRKKESTAAEAVQVRGVHVVIEVPAGEGAGETQQNQKPTGRNVLVVNAQSCLGVVPLSPGVRMGIDGRGGYPWHLGVDEDEGRGARKNHWDDETAGGGAGVRMECPLFGYQACSGAQALRDARVVAGHRHRRQGGWNL